MLSLIVSIVASLAPVGIDFSSLPVEEPARGGFKIWLVVKAANGDTYTTGRWGQFAATARGDYLEEVEFQLKDGGCQVRRSGAVLVVEALNGSPVTHVEVRVKDAIGPTPGLVWALRGPAQKPIPIAPKPRKVVKP